MVFAAEREGALSLILEVSGEARKDKGATARTLRVSAVGVYRDQRSVGCEEYDEGADWRACRIWLGRTAMSPRRKTSMPPEIKSQIESLFADFALPSPFILYRTDTLRKFVGESPHNLLPSQRKASSRRGWTVFLAFQGLTPSLTELERIIAFPDARESEIPLQEHVALGTDRKPDLKKADLAKLPEKFSFHSLEQLRTHLAGLKGVA